jgi:hypothetical protein
MTLTEIEFEGVEWIKLAQHNTVNDNEPSGPIKV